MSFLKRITGKTPKQDRPSSTKDPTSIFEQSRYKENPQSLFFEAFVLDVIGHLPAHMDEWLQSLNLQSTFKTNASRWRDVVREVFTLSDSIEIAILDLWFRTRESRARQGMDYEPQDFAAEFTDEYFKDGSTIDIWAAGELEAAEARVAAAQAAEAANQREAQSRKERSVSVLKAEGVPYVDHLPVIEAEAESTRRATAEVANRAVALAIVAARAGGMPQGIVDELAGRYGVSSALSPSERQFIQDRKPSKMLRDQFAWRFESLWVLLWALGFVDTLGRPDRACDPTQAFGKLLQHDRESFLKQAELRPQGELLDAADLIYRYHWAVRDAQLHNRKVPANLNADAVMERHYALNWLIGYQNQAWDDISTDT